MNLRKPTKIVSKKIRASAKGENCTLRIVDVCNHNTDTTVFAHLNTKFKGAGNKSPDLFGVYTCSKCHDWLDGRIKRYSTTGILGMEDIFRALTETQMKLYEKGLIQVK